MANITSCLLEMFWLIGFLVCLTASVTKNFRRLNSWELYQYNGRSLKHRKLLVSSMAGFWPLYGSWICLTISGYTKPFIILKHSIRSANAFCTIHMALWKIGYLEKKILNLVQYLDTQSRILDQISFLEEKNSIFLLLSVEQVA